jgi:hypothetical protein
MKKNERISRNLRAIASVYGAQHFDVLATMFDRGQVDVETVENTARAWIDADISDDETAAAQDVLSMLRDSERYGLPAEPCFDCQVSYPATELIEDEGNPGERLCSECYEAQDGHARHYGDPRDF